MNATTDCKITYKTIGHVLMDNGNYYNGSIWHTTDPKRMYIIVGGWRTPITFRQSTCMWRVDPDIGNHAEDCRCNLCHEEMHGKPDEPVDDICPTCRGIGSVGPYLLQVCSSCDGTGETN